MTAVQVTGTPLTPDVECGYAARLGIERAWRRVADLDAMFPPWRLSTALNVGAERSSGEFVILNAIPSAHWREWNFAKKHKQAR